MADLNALPGVFEQVRLVAGLRWRTLKNGMRRKNNVWDLVGMIFAGFFAAMLILGIAGSIFAGTIVSLKRDSTRWFALLFWGIFLWWQIFPVFVAGFGANFEFRTLLRFPLSRRAFYLLGIGYGLADFAAISAMCWLFSILLAAAVVRPSYLPVLTLVSVLVVSISVTMERFIGSALEQLLAKRKAREKHTRQSCAHTHSFSRTGVRALTIWDNSNASQLVSRMQPCDSAWPTFPGAGVPWMP